MRRLAVLPCMLFLAIALTACGTSQQGTSTGPDESKDAASEQKAAVAAGTPEEILKTIQNDFTDTSEKLNGDLEVVYGKLGEDYETYTANVDVLEDWYKTAETETEALCERTRENGAAYFKAVVESAGEDDYETIDDAMDEYYDAIYDDAFTDYYRSVYEDAYEDVYYTYYDDVIGDAYGNADYDEVSDTASDCYRSWSDSRSGVYRAWSDGRTDVYRDWSDVNGAFYSGDFDVNETLDLEG